MWNIKHLIIAILFAICAIACAITLLFPNDGYIIPSGFMLGGNGNNFAPIGLVIFTFFSVMFFKNAKR
ncbi:MAG: hypothetical protein IKK48_04265 [Firmicutes bacterium]|nr:hypothetical protein [Bacillota bacterium]